MMGVGETTVRWRAVRGKFIKNLSSVTSVGLDLAKNVFQVHAVTRMAQ